MKFDLAKLMWQALKDNKKIFKRSSYDDFLNADELEKKRMVREFRIARKRLREHKKSLDIQKYDGEKNNNDHLTGKFMGYIDPEYAVSLFGKNGEHFKWDFKKGSCEGTGRYSEEDWNKLKEDVLEKGIQNPIFIVVEYVPYLGIHQKFIYEGNHRARLACQLNIPLPVEINFFGKSEEEDDDFFKYLKNN